MRIAVDAMGGDFAPREIVRGAITYAASHADEVILVGDVPRIEAEIADFGRGHPASVSFVDAPEVIEMGERPCAPSAAPRSALRPTSSGTASPTRWSARARPAQRWRPRSSASAASTASTGRRWPRTS
jgi:hypothetical protein